MSSPRMTKQKPMEGRDLTPKEVEVVQLLLRGYKPAKIARTMKVSPDTVKKHISNISLKTGKRGSLEIACAFMKWRANKEMQEEVRLLKERLAALELQWGSDGSD